MAYLLNKTTGQLLINLVDGTADGPDINPGQNVSDLDLFGKIFYGIIRNFYYFSNFYFELAIFSY